MNKVIKIFPNGLRLLYEFFPGLHSFVLSITALSGSRNDYKDKSGLAHFVEHILFRRNQQFNYTQLAKEFEKTGTIYNAFTEQELTCFYLKGLNEKFEKVLDLITKFFTIPVFDPKDFVKERKIILEEIHSYEDDPEEFILDIGNESLFPNHPLGQIITGTIESVENITLDDIKQFFEENYCPNNLVVSFVGSLPFEQVEELVYKKLGDLQPCSISKNTENLPAEFIKLKELSRDLEQSHYLYQMRVENIPSSQVPLLKILSYYLSESPSSVIYNKLRERNGLVYSVFTNVEQFTDTNVLQLYFATQRENYNKAKANLDKIFDDLREGKIDKTLFRLTLGALQAQHIYRMEIPHEIMMHNLRAEHLNGTYLYNNFDEIIKKVNYTEFVEFVMKIFGNNQWSIVKLEQKE